MASRAVAEAVRRQASLAKRVVRRDRGGAIRLVGGADVGVRDGAAIGAIVVIDAQTMKTVEWVAVWDELKFPYVPGLLAFREVPVLRKAWERLERKPDLLLMDGQGIAHPRRCGLASHFGVEVGVRTVGVAKSRLIGEHRDPPARRGAWAPLTHDGDTIGAAVRTRAGVKPVYVSIGHRVSLKTAIEWAVKTARVRIPEPTRRADKLTR